ncbi:hypothetical protein O181_081431 [Austropuccinia psidii MF-1]|uniref:Secreted protein n=1 Tax=Austropuccinia psidii MF-1 TaxID=1389203 RepID=A0A9Q3FQP4_9BASI|nr:hypothetical protein [Austropuccinia psidii MF-1]
MFSTNLFHPQLIHLILIISLQTLFGTVQSQAPRRRPTPHSPNTYTHRGATATCSYGYTPLGSTGEDAYCLTDTKGATCDPKSCTFRDTDGKNKSIDQLTFPTCWKGPKRYHGARATSFSVSKRRNVIIVNEGSIINSRDRIPTDGISCAWSNVRPHCDGCDPY